MDTRFTQLHADVLTIIQRAGPKGVLHGQNSAIQVRIDQMYRPKKLDTFDPYTISLGQILEQLMLDNGYCEPYNPAKGQRDTTSQIIRITAAGKEALEIWNAKPAAERITDSTPTDLRGDPMGAPILPADSELAAQASRRGLRPVSVAEISQMADGGKAAGAGRSRARGGKKKVAKKSKMSRPAARGGSTSKPKASPAKTPAPAGGKAGALPRRR